MPSPLLAVAADPSGLTRTVHEYRTRLTDMIADELTPLVPRARRGELYKAAVRVVDEALPHGSRGITTAQIAACRDKLRSVAVFLRDAPPTPPALAEHKLAEGRSALAAALAALKAERRKLKRGSAKPVTSLARFRQEMHTAAREAASRRELELAAQGGGGSGGGGARDLMADALKASQMQSNLASTRAREASAKADAEAAWAKHCLALQSKRLPAEDGHSLVRCALHPAPPPRSFPSSNHPHPL